MDPISDQFAHVSVYNYAENSPVRFIDLHGLQRAEPVSGVKGPWSNEYVNRNLTNSERDQIRNRLGGQHETVIADLNKRHQVKSLGAFADASAVLFDVFGMAEAGGNLLDDAIKYGNRIKNSTRSSSRANSAVMYADDALSNSSVVEITTKEDGVMVFVSKFGDETVEAISHYRVEGEKLFLDAMHIQGSSAGKVGLANLRKMIVDLGRQFNVKEVVVQGGRRTTGKLKGQVPSPRSIKVE